MTISCRIVMFYWLIQLNAARMPMFRPSVFLPENKHWPKKGSDVINYQMRKQFVDLNSYEQPHWQTLVRKHRMLVLLDTGRMGGGTHLKQSHTVRISHYCYIWLQSWHCSVWAGVCRTKRRFHFVSWQIETCLDRRESAKEPDRRPHRQMSWWDWIIKKVRLPACWASIHTYGRARTSTHISERHISHRGWTLKR